MEIGIPGDLRRRALHGADCASALGLGLRHARPRVDLRADDPVHERPRRREILFLRAVRQVVPGESRPARGGQRPMTTFPWPSGTHCAVFVSINFDAEAFDLKSTTEDRLFGRFSYGRYGVRAGLPRMLAMLERRGIKATVFVTASDAERHADALRAIRDAGHEIASRGTDLAALPSLGERERD